MAITYAPSVNFGAKDSLPSNDPDKVIKGSEFSVEFTAIQTAFGLAAPAASPTFTGTVTIASVDINGGNIDGTVIGGATPAAGSFTNLTATGTTTLAGASTSADITFGDNDKAIFGAGSDLQIYHDGSHSYISDQGTGQLRILVSQFQIMNAAGTEAIVFGAQDNTATLFYDGSDKLSTTSTGIDVTGTVTADGLTVGSSTLTESASDLIIDAADDLFLRANGQDAIRIFQDAGSLQNVGFRNATQDGSTFLVAGNGDISFYEDTGTTAKFFWDASAEALGIGTSSPSEKLMVRTGTAYAAAFNTSVTSSSSTGISIGGFSNAVGGGGGSVGIRAHHHHATTTASSMAFEVNGDEEAMRIDSNGNVGIGTDTPGVKLGVLNGSDSDLILMVRGADNTTEYMALGLNGANGVLTAGASGSESTNMVFRTASSGTEAERMRLDASGNLLVGTTTAIQSNEKLAVSSSGTAAIFAKQTAGSNKWVHKCWNNATSGDNLLIEFLTEAALTPRGSITYNRASGAIAYNTSSDYRLKENIADLPNALETFLQLQPRQFAWKETGNVTTGFIAHELQSVVPEAVTGEKDAVDKDGNPVYQGIDQAKLVPLLTGALKEAIARIETLEAEVSALKGV